MELIATGKLDVDDRKELSEILDINVGWGIAKSFDLGEIIQLIFRDFDATVLLRDGILFSTLSGLSKKAFKYVKNKKPKAEVSISSDLVFEYKDKNIAINIIFPEQDSDKFLEEVERELTLKFLEESKDKEIIDIKWEDSKIKIQRI